MTEPGTDPFPPSIETPTAQLDEAIARLAGALVRETELTAALRKIEAERDDYKRLAEIADTLARECRIHESCAEAAEADNARLRTQLAEALAALSWAKANLQSLAAQCQQEGATFPMVDRAIQSVRDAFYNTGKDNSNAD
jgi:DNA repair exonuclease SbcCD ATPase subunit